MLNVYKKYERPEELDGYAEKYPLMIAMERLKAEHQSLLFNRSGLTDDDKEVLSKNIDIILREPKTAYNYALYVIKGRWSEGEPVIMKSPYYAALYAQFIIKGKWKEAEPAIMKDELARNRYMNYISGL